MLCGQALYIEPYGETQKIRMVSELEVRETI